MEDRKTQAPKKRNTDFDIKIRSSPSNIPIDSERQVIHCHQLSKKNIFQSPVTLNVTLNYISICSAQKMIKQFKYHELGELSSINICFPSENQLKTIFKQQYKKLVNTRKFMQMMLLREENKEAPKNSMQLLGIPHEDDSLFKSNIQLHDQKLQAMNQQEFQVSIEQLVKKQKDSKKYTVKSYHLLKLKYTGLKKLKNFISKNVNLTKFLRVSEEIKSKITQYDKQPRHSVVRSHIAPQINSSRIIQSTESQQTRKNILKFSKKLQEQREKSQFDAQLKSIASNHEKNGWQLGVPSI